MARGLTRNEKNQDSQLDFFQLTFVQNRVEPEVPQEPNKPNKIIAKTDAPDGAQPPEGGFEEIKLPPLPVVDSETSVNAESYNLNNYRISESDKIGMGSIKAKYGFNLAALQLIKKIETENRPALPEEKQTLVRYVGWGGIPQVFDEANQVWTNERLQLQRILSESELESARASSLNAHYTSPLVIRSMYQILERLGFYGGRILEPALGVGHFIGAMPDEMHRRSQITGIEIDSVTARMAKLLYPDSDIRHQPFEEAKLVDDFYDVAISNIPFGDYKPYDLRFKSWNFVIHDYFFARALETVKPGGLLVFISSKGTLDKIDRKLREYISNKADLLGAIRLPNDAFKRNANTEVTTDIVILRKRLVGELPQGESWIATDQITNSLSETITVNEYYARHPEMMLGEMRLEGRMYQRGEPTLVGIKGELEARLAEAINRLPQNIFRETSPRLECGLSEIRIPAPEYVKPNAFALVNGTLCIREGDEMKVLTDLAAVTLQRIRGLVWVRDAVRNCLKSQLESREESDAIVTRAVLNQRYDSFIAKFGAISLPANASAFRGDPDLPLLLSLEWFNPETKRATKAAIFRERTIQRNCIPLNITTAQDALLVTLNARGAVDVEYMGKLLGRASENVLPDLRGAIFLNPQTNKWETEDEYLSGNVRSKLAVADAATLLDEKFALNTEALKAVQPADLSATEIDARLGSTWIPTEDIRKFAEDLLGESGIKVSHAPELGLWKVQGTGAVKYSVANTTEWGFDRKSAIEILEDTLNLRTPTIYDFDSEKDRNVINASATEVAREKQSKIREKFKNWIWQEDERRERLIRKYNDEFNNIRLRSFNGEHLTLPGASSVIRLGFHQKAAVWRILQTPNCLLAHVVGAGKTYTMVAAAMELRRLGLGRKPLFDVPNHMLGQFSAELLTLYPGANILVATQDDFEKTKRQTLMNRIATGNWDAVIVTHSSFEKISVSPKTQEEFFNEQLRELTLAIENQRENENSRMVKILERSKKHLEFRLKELTAIQKKDDALTFEELGVDRLFVDEAHYFKNLFYVSKMTRIAGLPQSASQRALDMFLKVRHIQSKNSGGGVVFATGTPIANCVAEMFTMQRYLQMSALKALHVHHFDSWAGTFGEPVTAMELSPDGSGYRLNTRFARYINVPELMQQFRQVADIQTQSMLKLPIPALKGEKPTVVSALPSPELKEIVRSLVERAEAIKTGLIDPSEDNMLLITTDGRKAALDLRLHDPSLPDHPYSKVNRAVNEIEQIWRATREQRSTQLVFCDLSVPTGGSGFSVYEDMRDKLIDRGIPSDEIAFIQDCKTDAAKIALFRSIRSGKVRITFGSTTKMGSGTNVQERLITEHHLDAPWRPADVEQREGRILRQGNKNPEVEIFRYVTQASFDAYMWQTLETKSKFIAQVMTGETALRRIEDIDGAALTYAEVKAIASGNPLVIEKANVDTEVSRLSRLLTQHTEAQYKMRHRLRYMSNDLERFQKRLETVKLDLAGRIDTKGDNFSIKLENDVISDRGIAGELINRRAARLQNLHGEIAIGEFAGFKLFLSPGLMGSVSVLAKRETTYEARITDTALGTIRSVEYLIQNLEDEIARLQHEIDQTQKNSAALTTQSVQPFEYHDRLSELIKRRDEITQSLDLTKNQASNRLESNGTESVPDTSESETASLREIGFGDYDD